jgi:hypothetical protein
MVYQNRNNINYEREKNLNHILVNHFSLKREGAMNKDLTNNLRVGEIFLVGHLSLTEKSP